MRELDTEIAIVGAGPAGLMLAIELGCRGIACAIFEKSAQPPVYPKANATSARTMEHYRRRGLAERVRGVGLPEDHPQDIVYCTRLTGIELTRFRGPSAAQARTRSYIGDFDAGSWPSPELPHRGQQMFIEPILREEAGRYPSITTFFGSSVESLADGEDGVRLQVSGADGQPLAVRARYVVGCDGARSMVREVMGTTYAGHGAEQRAFFGGQMASIYIQSAQLATLLPREKAWQYWFVNGQRRGLLVAIDGLEKFCLGVQLAPGQALEDLDVDAIVTTLVGQEVDFTLLNLNSWTAGHTLVAESFRAGRCFIAGDAAHLFTPTSGMGYNTSIDDAVNLGWKLAAVVQGWAGDALLDSYESERQPIARRNTAYARSMADSMAALTPPPGIEDADAAYDESRREYGARCRTHVAREYNIPGLQLGVRYDSAVVAREAGVPPEDDATRYEASGYPGARAPHVAVGGDVLFDRFGRDFTLLCMGAEGQAVQWKQAAEALNIPLAIVHCDAPSAREIYGAELALIRPDAHIAWRGDALADAAAVLRLATAR
ncbi:MAG: FAD-dependent monooxygenase [Pseudomonadota bacterium]